MGGAMTAIEQAARFELQEGNRANLVVLNAESVWEAIWSHRAPLYVIKDGRDITLKQ